MSICIHLRIFIRSYWNSKDRIKLNSNKHNKHSSNRIILIKTRHLNNTHKSIQAQLRRLMIHGTPSNEESMTSRPRVHTRKIAGCQAKKSGLNFTTVRSDAPALRSCMRVRPCTIYVINQSTAGPPPTISQ